MSRFAPDEPRYPRSAFNSSKLFPKRPVRTDFLPLREQAIRALREEGALSARGLVERTKAGFSERDAKLAIKYLEQDGIIYRATPTQPWRLR